MEDVPGQVPTAAYVQRHGLELITQGYELVPLAPGKKFPMGRAGWQSRPLRKDEVYDWKAGGWGLGVLGRNTAGLDIDVVDSAEVDEIVTEFQRRFGEVPVRTGRAPRVLLPFRNADHNWPVSKLSTTAWDGGRVEVLGDGQQWVAYHIHPDTGKPYTWSRELTEVPARELPALSHGDVLDFMQWVCERFSVKMEGGGGGGVGGVGGGSVGRTDDADEVVARLKPRRGIEVDEARALLGELDADGGYWRWLRVGFALYHEFGGGADGLELWSEWASEGPGYDLDEMTDKWATGALDGRGHPNPITWGWVEMEVERDREEREEAEAAEASGPRYFKRASELIHYMRPPDWLVEGHMERGTLGCLYAPAESGKSFLACSLACAVGSEGEDWYGHNVHHGGVVYITGEGHFGFTRRLAAWAQDHERELADVLVSERGFPLAAQRDTDWRRLIRDLDVVQDMVGVPVLIVVDTLAANFGGNENDVEDMQRFIDRCHELMRRYAGATVMLVHHTGHAAHDRARGSSGLRGALDWEYSCKLNKKAAEIDLHCRKMKDFRYPDAMRFKFRDVQLGAPHNCAVPVLDRDLSLRSEELDESVKPLQKRATTAIEICRKLKGMEPCSENELHMAFRGNTQFSTAWSRLVEAGQVIRVAEGRFCVHPEALREVGG